MPDVFINSGVITQTGNYTADSEVPKNYLDWHSYASQMGTLGVRQVRCGKCKLYSFPKELVDGKCQKCKPE